MLAQISLTPAESKKFIAKAVANMESVRKAAREGIVVMHACSSTYFLVEELTGKKPNTNVWVCGLVAPRGACIEMGMSMQHRQVKDSNDPASHDPRNFKQLWILKRGEFFTGVRLGEILDQMGPGDVYVRGVNAIDTEGKVGILIANSWVEGGTAAIVIPAAKRQGFEVVIPVGLEKLIPVPIREVCKEARRKDYDYAMGVPCGLLPCDGTTVTEVDAVKILTGATAFVISAGGLGGAEGAVTFVVKGEEAQVRKAIEYAEQSKGARLPPVRLINCHECPTPSCFRLEGKHWVE